MPHFRETPGPQTWTARNIMNGFQRREGSQLFEDDPYFAICEGLFSWMWEKAHCSEKEHYYSNVKSLICVLCYIKCVISVIPNHIHCPQLLLSVFCLSFPRSFYTLPYYGKTPFWKVTPAFVLCRLGVGGASLVHFKLHSPCSPYSGCMYTNGKRPGHSGAVLLLFYFCPQTFSLPVPGASDSVAPVDSCWQITRCLPPLRQGQLLWRLGNFWTPCPSLCY